LAWLLPQELPAPLGFSVAGSTGISATGSTISGLAVSSSAGLGATIFMLKRGLKPGFGAMVVFSGYFRLCFFFRGRFSQSVPIFNFIFNGFRRFGAAIFILKRGLNPGFGVVLSTCFAPPSLAQPFSYSGLKTGLLVLSALLVSALSTFCFLPPV
jgi:hypothetical protein